MQEKKDKRKSEIRQRKSPEPYEYISIPPDVPLDVPQLQDRMIELASQRKKAIIALPPFIPLSKPERDNLLTFFMNEIDKDSYVFVSQEGLEWDRHWEKIVKRDLPSTDEEKALRWVKKGINKGKVISTQIGDIIYLYCSGNIGRSLSLLEDIIEEALENISLKGELSLPPVSTCSDGLITWSYLHGALIIDLANVFLLNHKIFSTLKDTFARYKLYPISKGIYFITSGVFQSWQLRQGLGVPHLHEAGNVIRTVPDKEGVSFENIIKIEVKNIAKVCIDHDPPIPLLVHQVQGGDNTIKAMRRFYSEFVLCDEMIDARYIQEHISKDKQERIFNITPASDPGLMILSPNLITQGYDMKLFADYILSQYQNKRGRPNEPFIYYFDTNSEILQKVLALVRMDLSHVLNEKQTEVLEAIEECETDPEKQGSFYISLLKNQLLDFIINLTFTEQGTVNFLQKYPKIFSNHFGELSNSLRIFAKKEPSEKKTDTRLHLIEDFNEITIRQDGFIIDVRLQENQAILTIKSLPDESMERRCFSLFSLLSTSKIFNRLPDKEILIELVSLLWKNFTESGANQDHGFVITLISSPDKSKLQVFQNKNNRALLKERTKDDVPYIQFSGQIPFYKTTTKRFMKPITQFFSYGDESKEEEEKLWRFSCFEALSAVASNYCNDDNNKETPTLCFDFRIEGDCWTTCFIFNKEDEKIDVAKQLRKVTKRIPKEEISKEKDSIPPQIMKKMQKGADKVEVLMDGRQIILIKNPQETELDKIKEVGELVLIELDKVEENAMLQEVEDVKAKEAEARSARLQDVYAQALEKLKLKEGSRGNSDEDDDEEYKPIEKAAISKGALQAPKRTELDIKVNRMIRRIAIIFLAVLCFCMAIIGWYLYQLKKQVPEKPVIPLFIKQNEKEVPLVVQVQEKQNIKTENGNQKEYQELIALISRRLSDRNQPSQDQLNALLKQLYFKGKTIDEVGGDIYNLTGRIYYYKIYFDREEKWFGDNWKERWKTEAYKAFSNAIEAYQKEGATTYLLIKLRPWMPEPLFFPNIQGKNSISYPSIQEAISDMQQWLVFLKR